MFIKIRALDKVLPCMVALVSAAVNYGGRIEATIMADYETIRRYDLDWINKDFGLVLHVTEDAMEYQRAKGVEVPINAVFDKKISDDCVEYLTLGSADVIPWTGGGIHEKSELIWWKYAKRTPFFTEIAERFVEESVLDSAQEAYAISLINQIEEIDAGLEQARCIINKMKARD